MIDLDGQVGRKELDLMWKVVKLDIGEQRDDRAALVWLLLPWYKRAWYRVKGWIDGDRHWPVRDPDTGEYHVKGKYRDRAEAQLERKTSQRRNT